MRATLASIVIAVLPAASIAQSPCLIASYPFDGNALDTTGNGHDGTVNGATLAPDRFGGPNSAYQFDGVDDFILLTGAFNSSEGTITAWVYVDDFAGLRPIVSQRDEGYNGIATTMAINSDGPQDTQRFYKETDRRDCPGGTGQLYFTNSDTLIADSVWTHLAVTNDGAQIRLFINCVEVTTYMSGGGPTDPGFWFDDMCANPTTWIGAEKRLSDQWYFKGRIDDVRMYDCVLTASEIAGMCELNTGLATSMIQPEVRVYPNPTNGQITVSGFASNTRGNGVGLPSFASSVRIEVKEVTGRLVLVETFNDTRQVQLQLNEPSGVYMLSVQTGNAKTSFRVVKQ